MSPPSLRRLLASASSDAVQSQTAPVGAKEKKQVNYDWTESAIPKLDFVLLVREIFLRMGIERVEAAAFDALHETAELFLVNVFEDAAECAALENRDTLRTKDIRRAMRRWGNLRCCSGVDTN